MLEFLSSPQFEIFDNVLDVIGPLLGGGALFLVQQTIKHKEDNQKSADEIKGEIYYYTRLARINILTETRKTKFSTLQLNDLDGIYQSIRDYQELIESSYILPFVKVCVKYNTLKKHKKIHKYFMDIVNRQDNFNSLIRQKEEHIKNLSEVQIADFRKEMLSLLLEESQALSNLFKNVEELLLKNSA
ncbi:hypothetical protein QV08_03335 [Gallibacterium salpingitidis]|uniref:Uncharacterized protein n=1 Tax=Gallibacterium salpingitidis TaxID=505341 RepID=A0AB36E3K6_9PAST|nr:hypothetical protein [Gallibacterium salpingitidis]OBX08846.1 hypothetical protein QV08_03335 [Gallibacterium salpingitidis]OBX10247.1 hypothetical protein QV09_06130 [Gallibacterium salpingitidis]WKS98529.1 hypothetical protein NYR30_06960 [Gallibacterium salpingitidis]